MNPVRVAHVTTVDISLRYLLLNQLRDLKESGYEVVGVSSPGESVAVVNAGGIPHIPVRMTRRALTPLADLRSLWSLYRVFRRERFTIVHTHTPKAGIFGRIAARLAGVPVVVHTHHGFIFHERSPWLWRKLFVLLERFAALHCDLMFSVNEEDVQTAIREGICGQEKLRLLGQGGIGIDVEALDPGRFSRQQIDDVRAELGIRGDVQVVGFIGRLVREKGLVELLEAARAVRQVIPEVRFLIVGPVDTAKPDAITPSMAAEHGVSDICVFTGRREDIARMCAAMDLFVLPSYREGFPRSPMEASAMGVPCIVTDVRGCRQAVENGRSGLIVPPANSVALAAAIIDLLSNREKARRMGVEGRRIALERFDERLVFETVRAEYARLLARRGLAAPADDSTGMPEHMSLRSSS